MIKSLFLIEKSNIQLFVCKNVFFLKNKMSAVKLLFRGKVLLPNCKKSALYRTRVGKRSFKMASQ